MTKRISEHGYQIAYDLHRLINDRVLPGLPLSSEVFWCAATQIFNEFIPKNEALLVKRETLQQKIDDWHRNPLNQPFSPHNYQQFLTDIGYLVPEQDDFCISTANVDAEVAHVAGPQLVVPIMNARFALNAANARWGSLYDALYGSDVIEHDVTLNNTSGYNPERGLKVQTFVRDFLDKTLPLTQGSHHDAIHYAVTNGQLAVKMADQQTANLINDAQFVGYQGSLLSPNSVLCVNNGLHIEIQIDEHNAIGKSDPANIKDVLLESAISTIQDCEDSVAAVDAADKVTVYANWLGLMKGDLSETINKDGKTTIRSLKGDRHYLNRAGEAFSLKGRSLQFIRNVGHLMTTDAVLTANNEQVPEGILDALVTTLIAMHDLNGSSQFVNSKCGSIYIVKPKMHGPEEVSLTNTLLSRIEDAFGLAENTVKMGIMDEERRTSVNLKECIRAAKSRVAFINTGFLDRTGDEIHTSMLAGPMAPKESMKSQKWIAAYEDRNVLIGLKAGLKGKAQIGKGMWATPDEMAAMLKTKIGHPKSGATCAWVPSPTAATLHVLHYHEVNVSEIQGQLLANLKGSEDRLQLDALLTIPLLKEPESLTPQQRQAELDNNVQGLLGYVVRWVNQGIGCSKVPDINNIGRMEDRATLRISSQHICNWLHHGLLSQEQVLSTMKRMATVVDQQNKADSRYINMGPDFATSLAFQAAAALIFEGERQPSGYTEPLLHEMRVKLKQSLQANN